MKKKTVIVITSTDMGWDCVIGVFSSEDAIRKSCLGSEDLPEGVEPRTIQEIKEERPHFVFTETILDD